jgi:hypothetical protein
MNEYTFGVEYRLEVKHTDTHPKVYYYVISQDLKTRGVESPTPWPVRIGHTYTTEHHAMEAGAIALQEVAGASD